MDFQGYLKEIFSTSLLKSGFHVVVILALAWIALKAAKKLSLGLVRCVLERGTSKKEGEKQWIEVLFEVRGKLPSLWEFQYGYIFRGLLSLAS
jgi:hypothetical protein